MALLGLPKHQIFPLRGPTAVAPLGYFEYPRCSTPLHMAAATAKARGTNGGTARPGGRRSAALKYVLLYTTDRSAKWHNEHGYSSTKYFFPLQVSVEILSHEPCRESCKSTVTSSDQFCNVNQNHHTNSRAAICIEIELSG